MSYFDHIPDDEKKKTWFTLLDPLLKARALRPDVELSPLILALNRVQGLYTWKTIKAFVEKVLEHVKGGERIFDRVTEVTNDPNPDDPIADMFAECRGAHYLLQKGFEDLVYFRQNNIDFHAKFDGKVYYIEVTCLHGPDFKIFGDSNPDPSVLKPGEKWEYSRKLTNFLKSKYSNKEAQFSKRFLTPSRCLILMITDLIETHELWFAHAKIQGLHPIQHFVKTQKIATVLYGDGTLYEPDPESLGGMFGRLNQFSWNIK